MSPQTQVNFAQPLNVLVVEDNQIDRRIIESMLHESASSIALLKSTDRLESALKLLEEHAFDVVILDLNLPDSEGEDTLMRLSTKYPDVAIVINTGAYEDEMGLHTLSSGAQDFLVKGKYTAYVLNKALHYALERKRLELELTRAYERLKETQSQLLQMEKMKVVGALAGGIAHEVKNPLATLLYGATYLCNQLKDKDEKVQTVLDNMREAVDKANNIVNDLLNFAGTSQLVRNPENLNELVEKALSLIGHEIDKKHIKVAKRFDQAVPAVKVDANRIEQVIVNLLLNAVCAVVDGGDIELKTYCHTLAKGDTMLEALASKNFNAGETIVICEVLDNGGGISEEQMKRVFDPFFTTKRNEGGVGLGLTVCKNIMENHEGTVMVENRSEGGVRARLVFRCEGLPL